MCFANVCKRLYSFFSPFVLHFRRLHRHRQLHGAATRARRRPRAGAVLEPCDRRAKPTTSSAQRNRIWTSSISSVPPRWCSIKQCRPSLTFVLFISVCPSCPSQLRRVVRQPFRLYSSSLSVNCDCVEINHGVLEAERLA